MNEKAVDFTFTFIINVERLHSNEWYINLIKRVSNIKSLQHFLAIIYLVMAIQNDYNARRLKEHCKTPSQIFHINNTAMKIK